MARSAVLGHNPGAGRQRDRFHSIARMIDALRRHDIAVTPRITAAPADATRLAAEAVAAEASMDDNLLDLCLFDSTQRHLRAVRPLSGGSREAVSLGVV